jgi:hypothetical protein
MCTHKYVLSGPQADVQVQDTITETSKVTSTLAHTQTHETTVHRSETNARAHVFSVFNINSTFQHDIAFSRNHAACKTAAQTQTNTTTVPLPLTRCASLRHQCEPSSVATTTFYSRAWVLRGAMDPRCFFNPFLLQNRLQRNKVVIKQK